jgi:hypothetical protein
MILRLPPCHLGMRKKKKKTPGIIGNSYIHDTLLQNMDYLTCYVSANISTYLAKLIGQKIACFVSNVCPICFLEEE